MTPEERLKEIEMLLRASAQQQSRHEHEIEKHNEVIDKHNEAIRGLILSARTCLDSILELREGHKRVSADIDKLREAQASTDEKLNILIETVDRIIRRRNGSE